MEENEKLKIALRRAKRQLENMEIERARLQDEVASLWSLMDELTETQIKDHNDFFKKLESDTLIKSLMISKKKADC